MLRVIKKNNGVHDSESNLSWRRGWEHQAETITDSEFAGNKADISSARTSKGVEKGRRKTLNK